MSDPGYIYCIVKRVRTRSGSFIVEANGVPLCKLGKSIHPPERHAEAVGESSTWHPEEFVILFLKWVPSMRTAEDKVHAFFEEETVLPAYPKGGVEWILAQPDRIRHVFDALEGEPVLESVDGLIRPSPVPRESSITECSTKDTPIERFVSQWDGAEKCSLELFEEYRIWCVENNEHPVESQLHLGKRLQSFVKNGLIASQRKSGNTNYYWKPPSATITFADWKEIVCLNNLTTAEEYFEWQSTHPEVPSLEVLLTGRFEGITNYNSLVEGLFGRGGRQR
jgi:hypothetical protein